MRNYFRWYQHDQRRAEYTHTILNEFFSFYPNVYITLFTNVNISYTIFSSNYFYHFVSVMLTFYALCFLIHEARLALQLSYKIALLILRENDDHTSLDTSLP